MRLEFCESSAVCNTATCYMLKFKLIVAGSKQEIPQRNHRLIRIRLKHVSVI